MPTKKEREYYRMGFIDGQRGSTSRPVDWAPLEQRIEYTGKGITVQPSQLMRAIAKPKRKLSAWNKYVKANSKKPRFRYSRSTGQYKKGQLNLKKMAVAFRKSKR
jgi:hypothetical protein